MSGKLNEGRDISLKIKTIQTALLCLALFFLMAGCTQNQADLTLEDLYRLNTADAIYEKYSGVSHKSTYYDVALSTGGRGDFTHTATYFKEGSRLYADFSFGYAYAVEGRNVYFKGEDGLYGVYAFFDDGYFEETYLLYATEWSYYEPEDGEKILSDTTENGVRKVVGQIDAGNDAYWSSWGIEGIMESVCEFDAKSGLMFRDTAYLLNGEDRRLFSVTEITHGNDDGSDFVPPEYVTLCKDMTNTRTVRFITPEQETFTFTVPKNAVISPAMIEDFELYRDQAFTILHEAVEYPDELTLYIKKV